MSKLENFFYYKSTFNSPNAKLYIFLSVITLYILLFIPSHIYFIGRTSVGFAFIAVLIIGWFLGSKLAILFTCILFPTNLILSYFLDPSIMLNFQGLTGKNTFMAHFLMLIIGSAVGLISELNVQLKSALSEIKELRGIIPICASCKDIRDDEGYWRKVETYIEEFTEARFSHGICKPCADKLYGDEEWYSDEYMKDRQPSKLC